MLLPVISCTLKSIRIYKSLYRYDYQNRLCSQLKTNQQTNKQKHNKKNPTKQWRQARKWWLTIYHVNYYCCDIWNHHHSRKHVKVCRDIYWTDWHNFTWGSERSTCFSMALNIKGDLNTEEMNPMILYVWAGTPQNPVRILTWKSAFWCIFPLHFIRFLRRHNSVVVWILFSKIPDSMGTSIFKSLHFLWWGSALKYDIR